MPDTIKLKRAAKSIADSSEKVLEKDEILAITPDNGSGKGQYQLKFGDGITAAKNLPVAIDGENADDMKISAITSPPESAVNPVISAGDTLSEAAGKLNKQQNYLKNTLGYERLGALADALSGLTDRDFVGILSYLNDKKLNVSDLYDGTDSSSVVMGATANVVRKINEKTDKNEVEIGRLNSDLDDYYKLSGGIRIPDGSDLYSDIYKIPGNYYCPTDMSANTLINCPTNRAFVMKVELSIGTSCPCQTIHDYLTGKIYYHTFVEGLNTWSLWSKFILSSDLVFGSIGAFSILANSSIRKTLDLEGYGSNYRIFAYIKGSDWSAITAIYCNNNQAIFDIRNFSSAAANVSVDYTLIKK